MRDLHFALRTLARTPLVTGLAILSLALGVGANVAIYSLFEQVLLRPLPVHEPERLVNLSAPGPKAGRFSCGSAGSCEAVFSYPMFRDLERARNSPFSGLAAHADFDASVAVLGHASRGEGMMVSGSYFPTLGLRPALGRLLGPADDGTVGGHPVAVLGHGFWTASLGADPRVLNQRIVVNGQPLTVVGVAPPGFEGTTLGIRPSIYVPLTMGGVLQIGYADFENRNSYWAYVFGRRAPGVSVERAERAVNAIYRPIIVEVEAPAQTEMSATDMQRFRTKEIRVEEGARGQSSVHAEAPAAFVLLFAVAGIVLLIACANIANLLLARGASRGMEMAVRLALGASRRQLLAQLLTESVLLGLLGGVASLAVSRWTLAGIVPLLPSRAPAGLDVGLRPSAVIFAAGLSVLTGVLFGLYPALQSTRHDLAAALRSNAGNLSGARSTTRFRNALVMAQIALAMALLVVAGLFLESLANVSRTDLGFRPEKIVTFRISPRLNGYDPARTRVLVARIEEALAALADVEGVGASAVPILSGTIWRENVSVRGWARSQGADSSAQRNAIGAGFFRTLGVPVMRGREFTPADAYGAPKVAVVNEAFVRKFDLGPDAVGTWMTVTGDSLPTQIVGVVRDARQSDVKGRVAPSFFTPLAQDGGLRRISFYVRVATDPERFLRALPAAVARVDPGLPTERSRTLPTQVRERASSDRAIGTLTASFAGLATLLAAVGLYGVLAYSVARRTREIGLRMALGADASRVRWLVMRQVGGLVGVGGAIGIAAAVGAGRAVQSALYGVAGHDLTVIALATLLLTLVALGAGYLPARRASRVSPVVALGSE